MANENIVVINKDIDNRHLVIKIPEVVVNKLERSQDEYMRKVGDCAILLTDNRKTVNDSIYKLEFSCLVDLCRTWQSNKDYIRDTFVLPAISEIFGIDPLHADSIWQINYDRSNNCDISGIADIDRDILYCETGYSDKISEAANNDFMYACVCDIYKDIMDRDLTNDKNYTNVNELGKLRTKYAEDRGNSQYEFFTKHVVPLIQEKFPSEDPATLTWECRYISGELKIFKDNTK